MESRYSRRRLLNVGAAAAGLLLLPKPAQAWVGTRMRKPKRVPVLTFITSNTDVNAGPGYSFASQSIGSPSADRLVVVCVGGLKNAANPLVSSVTIGGTTATKAVERSQLTNGNVCIWYLTVASGTTATIGITFDQAMDRCAFALYTITGLNSTTPTGTNSAGANTLNLAVSADGVMVAGHYNFSQQTCTWTGLTENCDLALEASDQFSSGSGSFTTAQTVSPTVTHAGGGSDALVAAAWR